MPRVAGTPFVMRSSWPCGCVTVTLVGGLASAEASASTAVAGRFLELLRVETRGLDVFAVLDLVDFLRGWDAACDRRVFAELLSRSLSYTWPVAGDLVCLAVRSGVARSAGLEGFAMAVRCAQAHLLRWDMESCHHSCIDAQGRSGTAQTVRMACRRAVNPL
jgi:hypothetical protein